MDGDELGVELFLGAVSLKGDGLVRRGSRDEGLVEVGFGSSDPGERVELSAIKLVCRGRKPAGGVQNRGGW